MKQQQVIGNTADATDNRNTAYATVPMARDRQSPIRFELDVRRQKAVGPKLLHCYERQTINSSGFAPAMHRRTVK